MLELRGLPTMLEFTNGDTWQRHPLPGSKMKLCFILLLFSMSGTEPVRHVLYVSSSTSQALQS